ncbi:hypothetical protein [Streptomyces zaomyceticus]|uniref:hypothetical protein n=1 Tax=Streptomyces zaomyceticus TaxID=68286 RepID=UPI00368F41AC
MNRRQKELVELIAPLIELPSGEKMLRRRAASVVAAAVLGSVALTACGGGEAKTEKPTASTAGVSIAAGTPEAKEQKGTGDWAISTKGSLSQRFQWTRLQVGPKGNVVNGSGLAIYRFENDSAKPSAATCNDSCATTWPPVLVDRKTHVYIDGISAKAVGVVQRADGTFQLTLNGWPLYRFNQDLKAGDLFGEGRAGNWFAVDANGQPAFRGGAADGDEQAPGNQTPGKPGAMTLLSDPNDTSENNAARRVTGSGCVDVRPQNIASAIRDISGTSVKIWSEQGCKGRSALVSADILDLNTIGFDNDISSVFFG